jgi:hypothetical protein
VTLAYPDPHPVGCGFPEEEGGRECEECRDWFDSWNGNATMTRCFKCHMHPEEHKPELISHKNVMGCPV